MFKCPWVTAKIPNQKYIILFESKINYPLQCPPRYCRDSGLFLCWQVPKKWHQNESKWTDTRHCILKYAMIIAAAPCNLGAIRAHSRKRSISYRTEIAHMTVLSRVRKNIDSALFSVGVSSLSLHCHICQRNIAYLSMHWLVSSAQQKLANAYLSMQWSVGGYA